MWRQKLNRLENLGEQGKISKEGAKVLLLERGGDQQEKARKGSMASLTRGAGDSSSRTEEKVPQERNIVRGKDFSPRTSCE